MSVAYKTGAVIATGGAWVASKAFHIACGAGGALGDFGQGVSDTAEVRFDQFQAQNEQQRALRQAKASLMIAEAKARNAAKLLALSAPAPAPAPAATTPIVAAAMQPT